uniref:Methyltransferase-like 26 n=1 Tax=Rhizochromulina marina TaxID=1034831 RepID=A0A7S2S713_9STRA
MGRGPHRMVVKLACFVLASWARDGPRLFPGMATGTGFGARTFDPPEDDGVKMLAGSAERNKEPILAQLSTLLEPRADGAPLRCLEVASGTGQHVAHFASALPHTHWIPSDLTDDTFASVGAWCQGMGNVSPPLVLDMTQAWAAAVEPPELDVVYVANMCHISPWEATLGLFHGSSSLLTAGGRVLVYGPFTINGGEHTSDGNVEFDQSLRARSPHWGYRDVDQEMQPTAGAEGFELVHRISMPSNNFLLVFDKAERAT